MTKQKFIVLMLSYIFICNPVLADINSATITESTLKAMPNCVHYKVRGLCYWLDWDGVSTTPYVEHYLPDVVVSVFNKQGDNPWIEMNSTVDSATHIAEKQMVSSATGFQAGEGQQSFSQRIEQNIFFKEADVIGNPALMVLPHEGFLSSTATPLVPYYQSMLDAGMWRGLPQMPTALVEESYAIGADITHYIGSGINNWGGVYPHEGKVGTSNDAKAAAVIAQRAGDLVTSTDTMHLMGHVFKQLSNDCGEECKASPIQENSNKTLFQMVYPIEESTCDYFGKTASYGEDIETKTQSAYTWVIWRFYSGCIQGNGDFIGKTLVN